MTATATATAPPATRRRNLLLILVVASLVTAISLGVRSTFALFLTPMTEALGTNRGGFALAIAIQSLLMGLGQPVAGALADRFGPARVLSIGAVAYAGGVLVMADASSTTGLYIGAGLMVGLAMAGASFAVVLAAVGRLAPPERRTWAMGIVTAAGSLGQFVLIQVAGGLQDSIGWRETLVVMAGVTAAILLFTYPLRADGRAGTAQAAGAADNERLSVTLGRAFRYPSYLMLCGAFFVCGAHVTFIGTHLPSYLGDVGVSRRVATTALALIGLFNVVGSYTAGVLGTRYSKTRLLSLIYALRAVVIAGFVLLPQTAASALVFGALIGLLWLGTVPLTSGIVVGQFGLAHAGTLFGFVFLSHQVGAFAGAWLGGLLADSTGSYNLVWWISVALGVAAALIHLFVKETPAPPLRPRPEGAPASVRPAVAGMATLAALVGASGAVALRSSSSDDGGSASAVPVLICPLHPTVGSLDDVEQATAARPAGARSD